ASAPVHTDVALSPPRRVTTAMLTPVQQLEAIGTGEWRSTGSAPQFRAGCAFAAGWVRIRLRMTSDVRGRLAIHIDQGDGFVATACVERAEVWDGLASDFYVFLHRPGCAVRLDPLDVPGAFRLEQFQIDPVPASVAWCRAAWGKMGLIWGHRGLFWPALGRAFRLIARGELATFAHKLLRGLPPSTIVGPDFCNLNTDYQTWRQRRRLTDADRAAMNAVVAAMTDPPRLSVLMPVYNTPEKYLHAAIDSVLRQTYPHWELCLADDASSADHVSTILAAYARRDSRIRVVRRSSNGGIAAASNSALDLATGEYVALLDHDDELAEHALFKMAQAIVADRGVDMLYSDEDKCELDGRHVEPFFKPDWSPELFLACMYTCHLGVYRTQLVREVGGFRSEFDTAQDYDLALRIIERTQRIYHIADVLYHWRKLPNSAASRVSAKPEAPHAGRRALQDHLARTERAGTVEPGRLLGLHRVRFALRGQPRVSIIIPSACRPIDRRGKSTYHILECVESIRHKSSYGHYEILLVHHRDELMPSLVTELDQLGVARLARDGAFNWSAAMNLGAATAAGDHLLFLNDDMEVLTQDWLETMLEFSQQLEIGAVGAKLLFPDGGLQHAGIVVADLTPRHCFYKCPGDHPGYFSSSLMHRNVSAVTGACLMTRADVFQQLGGFCEALAVNYNDVDYCLRVVTDGRRVVFTPDAQLLHYEGATKPGVFESELHAFRARWQGQWPCDPYYNANLSSRFPDYRIELG
ncbi:MAG: glycosyltransferase, partial [Gemmataceae bacterium]|nr:glycosyltransferase [Gemmataceae bacterium]